MANLNICRKLFLGQVTGHGLKHPQQIPIACFTNHCFEVPKEIIGVLYDVSTYTTEHHKLLMPKLKRLFKALEQNDNEQSTVLTQLMCDFGVVETLFDLLINNVFKVGDSKSRNQAPNFIMKCPPQLLDDAKLILNMIYICMVNSKRTFYHLRWKCKLLEVLFSLMAEPHKNIAHGAACILEEVLLGTDHTPVKLKDIAGLPELIDGLSGKEQKAQFLHTLSAFMSDSEYIASSHSTLEKHDQWLAKSSLDIVNANQEFLLRLPLYLERMANTACCQMNPDAENISEIVNLLQVAHLQILIEHHGADYNEFCSQINLYKEKALRADLFHIISLLLLGPYKNEVQERLSKCSFFIRLHYTAEQFVWRSAAQPMFSHFPTTPEECHPDTFIQIQFLRLIHSIADNHAQRYCLLSQSEIEGMKELASQKQYDVPEALLKFDQSLAFDGQSGLISCIVDKLKMEPPTSLTRFWITRAMEAFLRGEASLVNQAFLLNKNLIEDSMSVLLSCGSKHEMISQGVFDFLSMVMKFNLEAFEICEQAIDCTAKFTYLIKEVEGNLIDSNMFIRCIILTIHHIRRQHPDQSDFISRCRLLKHYSNTAHIIDIASKLVQLLTVPSLSQENVSCLNTSLLVLIFARRDQKLSEFLASMAGRSEGESVLRNLLKLLKFWKIHYTLPAKKNDRNNLQLSTAIKFDEWLDVADCLLDTDSTSSSAIQYYLTKPTGRKWKPAILPCVRTS